MERLFTALGKSSRILMRAPLKPVQGNRFQPTGFPELGAATYRMPNGESMLLVESPQSVANRLEKVCWDDAALDVAESLRGMPYVRIEMNGAYLGSSLTEAHRLNSPYILKSKDTSFHDQLVKAVQDAQKDGRSTQKMAAFLFSVDPNSLIHGIFLANIKEKGSLFRFPRLLSGFIEATKVLPVESGGVKIDRIEPSANTKEGFGNVLYPRTEYTAESITAFFNIDLVLLRSYGLGERSEQFLISLAVWKIYKFINDGLHLRTACDLTPVNENNELELDKPADCDLPAFHAVDAFIRKQIPNIENFVSPPVTVVNFIPPSNWKKDNSANSVAGDSESIETAGE
ncbi:type I-U CRISPR-associated protein Cas7 [Heliobacterium undosum]|uniref:Type I-U CRISPR-associated protein Cas7 n=1 Tax=Heliomicrobium undosum TaxID=121734 RepID=A0A845L058_9FIRM|nr:type I-U CRISPR-associated RAMP protein Csb1/Cas7u [Heliomicrobium undosum]MZP28926.1 type I-U CRISPR-associated protein Cas7 [Heliomicrobium undosum]